ncbi:hypothetical protein PACILC2_39930 [Paenibacillus cisolokensis]|uniref:RNA polymerase sigma-70 region 2 domain-containing protein n=1 Tax=Paenibacillus cisolokensis TaxID=1658519 RepID=A0ABQ4NB60_9BACL|nr:sigma factor [Paenibacillus cisolokensis]GIQ65425.1 hypothetical protein PACILC2_39930 [Paenibacillus cisolokensis]
MTLDQTYTQYKSMLFGLAYRMLGIAADSEDTVQDVFAQFMQLDAAEIKNEKAYLTKMTAKGRFLGGFEPARLNGEPGLLQKRDGRIVMAVMAEWEPEGSRIRRLYIVLNPEKLTRFNRSSPETCRSQRRAGSTH